MSAESGPFVLFIRHAERAVIPPDDPYADVDLTPRGYADVDALSKRLGATISWTASSPFLRCRVTAAGLGPEPVCDARLGAPGAWVVDSDLAATHFAHYGTEGVVRAQVRGTVFPGMRDPTTAVPLLLSAGLERLSAGCGVCVSHDAVLMPAMAFLFGASAAEDWLEPLDGFAVRVGATGPVAVWRGLERPC